jgi:uncharacterized protein (TIGR00255 family)
MRSMTGFGRGSGAAMGVNLVAEIKTVNHKYHDFSIKLPYAFQFLETELRDLILGAVTRGKVDCFVKDVSPAAPKKVTVNEPLLSGYIAALHKASKKFRLKGELTPESLLRLPDVMGLVETERREPEMRKAARAAVAAALKGLERMRSSEGERLKRDFLSRIREILSLAAELKVKHKSSLEVKVKAVREKVAEWIGGNAVDAQRMSTEEGLLLTRFDISEELTRLASHLEEMGDILKEKASVGRRLDFLL